jgi:hypothetical protein
MRALRLVDFLTATIKRSGQWMLVLEFWPTEDEEADWSWLSWTLPWLPELAGDRGMVCGELRRHGLALVACESEEEARRLFDQIQGFRVGVKVFASSGAETGWALPGNRPGVTGRRSSRQKSRLSRRAS